MDSDFASIKEKLCLDRTIEGTKKRQELFNSMDTNKNGFLSFSEVDSGLKNVLNLPEIFVKKEVIRKAFDSAKGSVKNKKKSSDEFIEKNEFRYFLVYLRQYFEFSIMFERINNDGNKTLTFQEFKKAIPLIEMWGLKISNPEASFKQIDVDSSGLVRFDEFCEWAIKNQLDLENDDDFSDECLKNLN
jgi:Ca2+-binding EF-hand superfamily protein